MNELYKECINKRNELSETINNINSQRFQMLIAQAGEEQLVRYDIYSVWEDYEFVLQGVLYRLDNCMRYLDEIRQYVKKSVDSVKDSTVLSIVTTQQCNYLSYEFENLLVAFSRLNEEPLIEEICRQLSGEKQKTLRNNCYRRNDIDGLYWKLNLLRNRAAHSTPGYYTQHKNRAARYMSISSKIRTINFSDGIAKFETSLINLSKSDHIKNIIKKNIIDGGSNAPVMDFLFSDTTPKGHGKNNPVVIYPINLPRFDLNTDFLQLTLEMMRYIEVQLSIFQ